MDAQDVLAGAAEIALYDLLRARLSKTVLVSAPAAGADWSIAVPGAVVWQVEAVTAILTTSATVANRLPRLRLGDGSNTFCEIVPQSNQAASIAGRYSYARGLSAGPAVGAANGQNVALPKLAMLPAWTLTMSTLNIDATDQWSGIVLDVVELSPHGVLMQGDWLADHLR